MNFTVSLAAYPKIYKEHEWLEKPVISGGRS